MLLQCDPYIVHTLNSSGINQLEAYVFVDRTEKKDDKDVVLAK